MRTVCGRLVGTQQHHK